MIIEAKHTIPKIDSELQAKFFGKEESKEEDDWQIEEDEDSFSFL